MRNWRFRRARSVVHQTGDSLSCISPPHAVLRPAGPCISGHEKAASRAAFGIATHRPRLPAWAKLPAAGSARCNELEDGAVASGDLQLITIIEPQPQHAGGR